MEETVDSFRLQAARKGTADLGVTCNRDKSHCQIDPDTVLARSAVHRRQMLMLISETIFVLSVVGYGSFRVIRSVQREKQLALERITFLNSVTHELKTPVAGALLAMQTLQNRKLKESAKKDLLEDAIDNLKQLTSQIENLLLAGELGRTHQFNRNQVSDAASLIRSHVKRSSSSIHRAKATVELDLPEAAGVLISDNLLERIVDALLQNALAYSGKRPLIRVTIETTESQVLIRVSDSGPGIPAKEHDNVFQPFYRLANVEGRGTGLGLYLVRQIVEGNGGTVQINPERNSEFVVRLRRAG